MRARYTDFTIDDAKQALGDAIFHHAYQQAAHLEWGDEGHGSILAATNHGRDVDELVVALTILTSTEVAEECRAQANRNAARRVSGD